MARRVPYLWEENHPDGVDRVTNPTWFVLTVWADQYNGTKEDLAKWLQEHHAKEGVVGREISPSSGKVHYQCKIHLDRGETLEGWKALIGPYGHVEIAQNKKFDGYEEKDGDFIKWPASPIGKFADIDLLPWQREVLDRWEKQDDRKILVIIDEIGGCGKSTLAKHMEAKGMADVCPVVSDEYNDYTGYCMEFPAKGYVFDVPRASSIKRRCAMWSGLEQIKNGLLFEKRYKPRKMWIEPPKMIVITNEEPPWEMLSQDRWDPFYIKDEDRHQSPQ